MKYRLFNRAFAALLSVMLIIGIMPATALAADGIELYVAGQRITESGCYANQDGTWTKVEGTEPASGQFSYDAATFTLTLNQAEISYDRTLALGTKEYYGSVIAYSPSADVSLNIVVSQGTSTITGNGGIRVESTTGNASLSIKGSGSLDVEPKGSNSGITLCSSKNRNLDIDGADVTASSPALYGVYLISSTDASSTSTITVNNGSLTTGGNGNVGIYYYWSGTSNAGTSSLTVSGNAVVDTRNSQIMAQNKETVVQVGAGSDGNGGIVFNGKSGTVYGDVTLQEDLEIGNDETLTIGKDASLTVPDGKTLTNNGTINVESGGKLEGTTTGNGTLKIAPTITTQPQDVEVKENETATFNVKVTGTEPLSYQWQQSTDNGQSWTDITGETNATYTIATTTMDMSGTQYRCVVKNSIDEVTSDAALLTVKHNLVKTEYKAPTCTVNGNEEYWICENCGKYFSDANGDTEIEKDSWIISAINHSWNDAVYTWSDDGSTCTATRTCKNDSTHTETSKATVTGAQTKAPTCTEKGETTYKATFEADWAMTQTKVLADISATGHGETERINAKDATCTQEGYTGDQVCKDCGAVLEQGHVTAKIAHNYKDGKCTVCGSADPTYNPNPQSPQTGDRHNVELWSSLLLVAAASFVLLTAVRRREQEDA
ncbi:MAG TPA: immunoglobulin domain-containing protein [Candidatus Dorea merdavium]|nr:immunoglobulin domain-containing protein [Candidatus Dorea merdavium]